MTDEPRAGGPGKRPAGTDFDLVEDIGDAAAFDRALDELLPKGDLSTTGQYDIDPDDFEAFNRELDAQMAQARARAGRIDLIEDLGRDVVEPAPASTPRAGTAPRPAATPPREEPEVADDVVTLGTIAAAMAAPAAAAQPAPPSASAGAPAAPGATPSAAPAATPPTPRPGHGPALAVALGLAGLLAGAAALWISLEREAELSRLREALAERRAAAAVSPTLSPAPMPTGDTQKVQDLERRLEEVTQRLAVVTAPTPPSGATPKAAPAEARAAPQEPPAVEAPSAPAQPAPPAPAPTPAAKPAPPPMPAAMPAPPPTAPSGVQEPPLAAAPAPAQSLPKPSGNGSWAVVIDSFADESVAEQRSAQIARMGLPTEVRWYTTKDQVRYRVVVPGYSTQDAANAAAAELRRRKAGGAWVMRLQKQE